LINFIKKKVLYIAISIYHFIFTIISYNYYLKNNGDASLYWFLKESTKTKKWIDFLHIGTDAFMFINYPLVKFLNLSIFAGFIFHSSIGLVGIFKLNQLIKLWIGDQLVLFGVNCIPLLLFMPNMHYWTSILGKEPLMFLCIASILIEILKKRYFSFKTIILLVIILVIRPHLFSLLFTSMSVIFFIYENWSKKRKVLVFIFFLIFISLSFILFLKISKINTFDWNRIKRFNEYSLLSLEYSKSYIPMIEYCFPMKIFTFYFRPLFVDCHNVFGFFVSFENALYLFLHIISIYLFIRFYKIIKFDSLFKVIVVYSALSALVYVLRYSDLGLIIRTKSIIQPFVMVAIFWMINQIEIYKAKRLEKQTYKNNNYSIIIR
jgi:hypothetical protein